MNAKFEDIGQKIAYKFATHPLFGDTAVYNPGSITIRVVESKPERRDTDIDGNIKRECELMVPRQTGFPPVAGCLVGDTVTYNNSKYRIVHVEPVVGDGVKLLKLERSGPAGADWKVD